MLLFFVGEIISSDIRDRRDKQTGEITYNLVVNVALRVKDKNGKTKIVAEDVVLPYEYKDLIEKSEGKYILIPYNYLSTKDSSFLFVDSNYQPVILENNPFEKKQQVKQKAVA